MKRIKHSSIGDYITTLSFFCLTILSFAKANEVIGENHVKASTLFALSAVFLVSTLRFLIARAYYKINELLNRNDYKIKKNRK